MLTLDKLLTTQRARRQDLQQREEFTLGDQWDEGRGWVGPNPKDDDTATDLIRPHFVQRNALKEVVTRHRDAVIGKEPQWDLTSADKRVTLRKEAIDALVTWWDDNQALEALQEATLRLLFAQEKAAKGEVTRPAVSPIRLFLRASSVGPDGRIPHRKTLAEALGDIAVHAASPVNAGVLKNLDGDPIATRYEYTDETNQKRLEVTGVARNLASLGLDVTPTDDTLVLVMAGNQIEGEPVAYPLAGRLLVHEMTREPLITPGAVSQQKLINKAWTMLSHNMDVAGFTERVFLNAQSPGRWVDENGNPSEPGEGKFVPDPLFVGAGSTNHVVGLPEPRADGGYTYTSPNVLWRDPVDPETFLKTSDGAYRAILEECKQLHVLLSADGAASGASRKQATADYLDSLDPTARAVQGAVRWMLGTALRLAGVLMNEPERHDSLRPMSQVRITVVQPTPEDVKATIEKRDARLISRETAMSEVGIEDPDAEMERIKAEEADAASDAADPTVEGGP